MSIRSVFCYEHSTVPCGAVDVVALTTAEPSPRGERLQEQKSIGLHPEPSLRIVVLEVGSRILQAPKAY